MSPDASGVRHSVVTINRLTQPQVKAISVKMKMFKSIAAGLLALSSLVGAGQVIKRATLTQVTNFGANTSGTKMYIYVPAKLATKPAIIVAIHYCTGTASGYYSATPYAQLAEQYGFIVIYPESPYSGTCWDVSSTAALTHNGGADSNSIANMVTYTLSTYSGDASRVFVTGSSSGAMMTVSHIAFVCWYQDLLTLALFRMS
jgi:acetylxylan esterase